MIFPRCFQFYKYQELFIKFNDFSMILKYIWILMIFQELWEPWHCSEDTLANSMAINQKYMLESRRVLSDNGFCYSHSVLPHVAHTFIIRWNMGALEITWTLVLHNPWLLATIYQYLVLTVLKIHILFSVYCLMENTIKYLHSGSIYQPIKPVD